MYKQIGPIYQGCEDETEGDQKEERDLRPASISKFQHIVHWNFVFLIIHLKLSKNNFVKICSRSESRRYSTGLIKRHLAILTRQVSHCWNIAPVQLRILRQASRLMIVLNSSLRKPNAGAELKYILSQNQNHQCIDFAFLFSDCNYMLNVFCRILDDWFRRPICRRNWRTLVGNL